MKPILNNKKNKAAVFVIVSLAFALLTAAAVYCIHKFLLDNKDEFDEYDDEEYIDENGVCYTDERNFVD